MDIGDVERIDDLETRVMILEKRKQELVVELVQMSAEKVQAEEKVLRLEARADDLVDLQWLKEDDERAKLLIEARREARRLLMLVKIHKLHTHHNLCWMNDVALWREVLYDQDIQYPHDTIPSQDEFEPGCESWCGPYYKSRKKCQGQLLVGKPPVLPGYENDEVRGNV